MDKCSLFPKLEMTLASSIPFSSWAEDVDLLSQEREGPQV